MRKKQPYGGLSPHYVHLIRDYLREENVTDSQRAWNVLSVWMWLLMGSEGLALERAKAIGLKSSTVDALKAGVVVLKRKRLGRLSSFSPKQSFAALGITAA